MPSRPVPTRSTPAALALTVVLLLGAVLCSPLPGRAEAAEACFAETGYCVSSPDFLVYFRSHGGEVALGYPISRELRLRGEWLQLFQRAALRRLPDGSVAAVELPSERYLPIERVGGSELPDDDPELLARAPSGRDGPERLDAWIRDHVPNEFEGRRVNFRRVFSSLFGTTEDPRRAVDLFGLPTSRPRLDPTTGIFVYQRFQRAIFQHDAGSGATTALLLGEYLKGALTGRGLPPDLEADLQRTAYWRQYSPWASDGLHRPWELPDTDLAGAFQPGSADGPRLLWPAGFGARTGWPLEAAAELETRLEDGEYVVALRESGELEAGVSASVTNGRALRDFALSVDARLASADGPAGYAIHSRRSGDDRYTLLIDAARGLIAAYRLRDGSRRWLLEWAPLPGHRAPELPNRFVLRLVGRTVAAWVNGFPLFETEDDGPVEGAVWLSAVSWGGPVEARFANLRVLAPD